MTSQHTIELRARSGTVTLTGRLTAFLYDLMRDHLNIGAVEKIVQESTNIEVVYTNGWLARYAEDIAQRLQPPIVKPSAEVTPEDRAYAVRALHGDEWQESTSFGREMIERWIESGVVDYRTPTMCELIRVAALFACARSR